MIVFDAPERRIPRAGRYKGQLVPTSHLMSTLDGKAGTAELVAFAEGIGLQRRWLQHPGEHKEHFDLITQAPIDRARRAGARPWTQCDVGRLLVRKRQGMTPLHLVVVGGIGWTDRDLVERCMLERVGAHRRVLVSHTGRGHVRPEDMETEAHLSRWLVGAGELAAWVAAEHGWEARPLGFPTADQLLALVPDRYLSFGALPGSPADVAGRRAKRIGWAIDFIR